MKTISVTLWLVWLSGAQASAGPQAIRSGLSVTIKAKQDSVKLGSAMAVEVTIKNTSGHDLLYIPGDVGTDLDVLDENGQPVKTTKEGDFFKGKNDDDPKPSPDGVYTLRAHQGSAKLLTMKANESGSHEIEIGKLFDFQRPGKYTVQVKWMDPNTKTIVESNVIKITALP